MKNINRIHLNTVDSTSNHARALLDGKRASEGMTLIDADDQTAGRGQRGNSWETEEGKNIIFSLVCHPVWLRPSQQYVLSEAIALAVVSVLRRNMQSADAEKMSVKWPNDIYYADKKISGTLIECDLFGRSVANCIVGTGVNINQEVFRSDAPNPVSLRQIVGRDSDREQIMKDIVCEFVALYDRIEGGDHDGIHEEYKRNLYRNDGGMYAYADEGGEFYAKIIDVEPSGRIILATEDGEVRRYEFKEVKFIL